MDDSTEENPSRQRQSGDGGGSGNPGPPLLPRCLPGPNIFRELFIGSLIDTTAIKWATTQGIERRGMRPSTVLDMKRSAVRKATGRFHPANLRVFSSVLHGTDRDGSDLDLLIDASPGATLFDLSSLQDELESLLDVQLELPIPADLPPGLAKAQPV